MKKYSVLIFFGVVIIAVMFLSGCSGSGSNYYRGYNDSNVRWGTSYVYYDRDHNDDHDDDNKPPNMGRPDRPDRPTQLPSRPVNRPSKPRPKVRRK